MRKTNVIMTLTMLGFVFLLSGSGSAEIICEPDQQVCDKTCYSPTRGQQCLDGIVCASGQQVCGKTCYTATGWPIVDVNVEGMKVIPIHYNLQ